MRWLLLWVLLAPLVGCGSNGPSSETLSEPAAVSAAEASIRSPAEPEIWPLRWLLRQTSEETAAVAAWLQIADELIGLSAGEARQRLVVVSGSDDSPLARFEFALLNLQLDDRRGWETARDQFRALGRNDQLADDIRRLARLLESLSQVRINADQRLAALRDSVAESQTEAEASQAKVRLLEEKIHALTDLENSMQQRRNRQDLSHE